MAWLVPPLVAVFLLAGAVIALLQYRSLSVDLASKADRTALLAASALQKPLWDLDGEQVDRIREALLRDPEVALVTVTDPANRPPATLLRTGDLTRRIAITQPGLPDKAIGEAVIQMTRKVMAAKIRNELLSLIATMLLALATVILLNRLIQRRLVIQPLEGLLDGIRSNSDVQSFHPVAVGSSNEFGFLAESFNTMMAKLKLDANRLQDMVLERERILGELASLNADLEQRVSARTSELGSANARLSETMQALWGEMALAKKIQTVLLPEKPAMAGFEIHASLEPADEVGGDYYDVLSVDGHDWIVVGDVSGHGVPAGLVMMMVQTAIHTVLLSTPATSTATLLSTINRIIYLNIRRMDEQKHMTILVLARGQGGVFQFSGLHEDILLWRTQTRRVERVQSNGMWIGIEPDISDRTPEDTLTMHIGDCMILFTDGVIEARRAEGGLFGEHRLVELIEAAGDQPAAVVHGRIKQALASYDKPDDVTLVVIKRRQ